MSPQSNPLDDSGTHAGQATEMLQKLLHAHENDATKLSIALGRSEDEIKHALSGNAEAFDDDLVMKIKGLAKERGVEL